MHFIKSALINDERAAEWENIVGFAHVIQFFYMIGWADGKT